MSKFQRSWLLFKASVSVVAQHRRLLVFPLLGFFLTAMMLAFFLVPIALQSTGFRYDQPEHWSAVARSVFVEQAPAGTTPDAAGGGERTLALKPLGVVCCGVAYLLSMFLATFFNVAFYHEILGALKGDEVSVSRGLSFAASRWKSILLWAMLAGVVGLAIQRLEEKFGFVGRWIVGLIGMAWSVASVFVVPVLVTGDEALNPFALLKKSAETLKRTWGESLVGFLGLRFGGLLFSAGSIVLLGGTMGLCILLGNWWAMLVVGVLWFLSMLAFAYVTSVAGHVYRCALYLYSVEGTIAGPYDLEMLGMAWKTKKA